MTDPTPPPSSSPRVIASAARHLCVAVEPELYALPLLCVREIQAYAPPTPVPSMPEYVSGVTNLHGVIVPVVDLRMRLSMNPAARAATAAVVFVTAARRTVGLVVDAATRVVELDPTQITSTPDLGGRMDTSFIAGLARLSDGLTVLLDVEKLLTRDPSWAAHSGG